MIGTVPLYGFQQRRFLFSVSDDYGRIEECVPFDHKKVLRLDQNLCKMYIIVLKSIAENEQT